MSGQATGTFWDHLDILRWAILRSLAVAVVFAVAAFCLKDLLFAVVLAPRSSDFVTFRLMGVEPFSVHLMNTGLTEQFLTHMRVAMYAGVLCAAPYIIYELFRFISPGLYAAERRAAVWLVTSGYVMFMLGTLLNYLLIFPLTVRFLGTYQVSADVDNMLTLQSYIDTLLSMSLIMGIIFELPVVCAILGRLGMVNRRLMSHYRRHAVVAILIVAAIITPTTDVFTLCIVSLPIWLLYEASILLVPSARPSGELKGI
ncbi:MAG: twin-arginine translocase subunit TatC [Prevotella sp.]|nr:twin-arginine translocase subunit TatC [Prevotella sp.]